MQTCFGRMHTSKLNYARVSACRSAAAPTTVRIACTPYLTKHRRYTPPHALKEPTQFANHAVEATLVSLTQLAKQRLASLDDDLPSEAEETPIDAKDIQQFISSSQNTIATLDNQNLAACIRGLGLCCDDVDAEWLRAAVDATASRLSSFSSIQLSQIVWGFAELGCDPGQQWLDSFLAATQSQLQDFYSPHLCDLIWGLACIYRERGEQLPVTWMAAFMEESGYQLDEFPADFTGLDLAKLISGLAIQRSVCDLDQYPGWLDKFMKSAYMKTGSFGEVACVNQSLAKMGAKKRMIHRDSRCTHEEVNWLPRHERDMRRIHKNYRAPQWGGWENKSTGS